MAIIKKDSQPFQPYARLMNIIGDQLITNKKVAIIEIIKNSYDADAESVQIRFFNIENHGKSYLTKKEQPYIEIEDDGDGMTLETIKKIWLRPATPSKLDKKRNKKNKTQKGRIIQGEKGIGRFAIHKIGEKIELYTKALNEVIGVFQHLLAEQIIQNNTLLKSIDEFANSNNIAEESNDESLAKLYHRIYYTKIIESTPLMTGDIFKFNDDTFGILITPECDMNKKKEKSLEFLELTFSVSKDFIEKMKKKNDTSIFNNGVQKRHILPSFPFSEDNHNNAALITFESAFIVKPKNEFEGKRSRYKLNSPYIYQLRQRYLAFIGRVGVPAIPESLKKFNLK